MLGLENSEEDLLGGLRPKRRNALQSSPRLSVDPAGNPFAVSQLNDKQQIADDIHNSSIPRPGFYLMNLFATIVCTYGLLLNSTAVVIGAMVIAVLLGPIAGVGLSLITQDKKSFLQAALAIVSGSFEVFLVSFLIASLHSNSAITQEILSRTQPNLFDLIIALSGGAAGAYAVGRKVPGGTMIGVAIATALVPPLASAGISAAHGNLIQMRGAMLLFFSNLIAIQCAYSIVLYLLGFRRPDTKGQSFREIVGAVLPSLVLFLILAVLLGYTLEKQLEKQKFEIELRRVFEASLASTPGAYLSSMDIVSNDSVARVVLSVEVPTALGPVDVQRLEYDARRAVHKPVQVSARSISMKIANSNGYLFEAEEVQSLLTNPQAPKEWVTFKTFQDSLALLDSLTKMDSLHIADSLRTDSILRSKRGHR